MSDRIRWGVIGAGGIARRRTIPEGILAARNATLAAVFDVRDCDAIAAQFGARACRDEAEILDAGVDAVYIATPVDRHVDQVVQAAAAGKHVFCEKPLGLEVAEAERIVAACDRGGVMLSVGLLMRFHALHQAAKCVVRDGALGTMVLGRAQLSCWYPPLPGAWRQEPSRGGGGSLIDMGGHCIDLLEQFFGPTRAVICTTARRVHDYPVEDTAAVLLEFASGARGMVDCLFNVPDESVLNRLELYGSAGSLLAERTLGQDPGGTMVHHPRGGAATAIVCERVNTNRAEIEAFSDAALHDVPPPVCGAAGLWNQRVLAACYESARSGRRITLPVDHQG